MTENTKLRIYTRMVPEEPIQKKKHSRLSIPLQTFLKCKSSALSGERMLRNSAVACLLLLGILMVGNINQPWAQQTTDVIQRALTMQIDLDGTIGELSFVRNLMPESALVFLNLSDKTELTIPVEGTISHQFTQAQPWLMFQSAIGNPVRVAADGIVTAVSELSGGTFGVLVDHGGGIESVYAYMASASVHAGDAVKRGQTLGSSDTTLYFEYRNAETPIDPSEKLGL